jgi:hypothetical protein
LLADEVPMLRSVTPRRLRLLLTVTAFALTFAPAGLPASAQPAATKHVPAKLVCGSHSADRKKLTPFQVELTFNVSGSLWLIDRKTTRRPGEEKFLGILSPSGTMLIVGEGKADDGATWTYEFSGRKSPNGITILRGSLQSAAPKGTRACSLAF